MIFVWSVQHTGTWSTIDWLERHEQFESLIERKAFQNVMAGCGFLVDLGARELDETVSSSAIYHDHCAESLSEAFGLQLMLAYALPCVVPLRDPLASLLTGYNRLSQASNGTTPEQHIEQWRSMAEGCRLLAKHNREPTFIAWDVMECEGGRRALLASAAERLGCRDDEVEADFAAQWTISNSSGSYSTKIAYERGDAEWLSRSLPGIWLLLKEAVPQLRPFLEAQGYRDLMWW